jgi:hypothetical protein
MKYTSCLLILPPVLLGLALLATLFCRRHSRWFYLPTLISCQLVAAALLWLGGVQRPVVRAELRSLEVALEDRAGQPVKVTLGGADGRHGGQADSLYVPEYPPQAFEFRRDKTGTWQLTPGAGWRPELIAWSGQLPLTMKEGLPALIPLSSGDRLHFGEQKLDVVYEEKQPWKREALLRRADRSWTVPNRQIEIPVLGWQVPLFSRQSWRQRVYPLRDAGFTPARSLSVLLSGLPHREALGTHLLLLDAGLTVSQKTPQTLSWHGLQPGASLRLDELLPAGQGRAPRLSTRRQWSALQIIPRSADAPAFLRLRLERPQVQSLAMSQIAGVPAGSVPRLLLHDPFEDSDSALSFSQLSHRFDQANGELRQTPEGWIIRDDRGDRPFTWGQVFWLGGDHRLEMQVQRVGVPWQLMGLISLGAFLTLIACYFMPGRGLMPALFFGLSFLASVRLLSAHAAWVNPPHDAGVVAVAAQVVWLLPLIMMIFWRCAPWLISLVSEWLAAARAGWTYPALILLALGLLGLRLGLGLAGFKEALPLPGARLALSLFFVPAQLILFALALCRLETDRITAAASPLGAQWRFLAFIYGLFFPAQLAAGIFVSDLGTFLYFLPPTLVLAAQGLTIAGTEAASFWQKNSRVSESRLMALIGALLFMLPAAGLAAVMANPLQAVSVFPEVRAAMTTPGEVVTDSNVLRLMQFIDEEALAAIGTDEAQRIGQDHALMRNYAHRGLMGSGYLGVEVVHAKRETALNDNVFAVYGLAQFGVIGAVALVAAYAAIMLSGCSLSGGCSFGRHLALLAALALGLTSLYMMGANTGLLPFTGRNMYLLGLNSLGDVAETAVLTLLVVVGLSFPQPKESNILG